MVEKPEKQRASDSGELYFQRLLRASLTAHENARFDLAETGYSEILARFPDHAPTYDLYGTLLYQTGREARAAGMLEISLCLDPSSATASNRLGAVRLRQGRAADAVRAFAWSNASDPSNLEAWLNRSRVSERVGDFDQAVAASTEALARFPGVSAAYARAGGACLARREADRAVSFLEKATATAPFVIEPYLHLSMALRYLGHPARSQAILRKAITLAPEIAALYPHLTDSSTGSAPVVDTAMWARRAVCLAPLDSGHWARLAAVHEARRDDEEAIAAGFRALLLLPDSHAAHQSLALSLFRQDRFADASRASRFALLLFPDTPEIQFVAAACAFISGDMERGWEHYGRRVGSRIDSKRVGLPELWGRIDNPGHLLVAAEQGVGDEYIFLSRLPCLRGRASRVTVECDPRNRVLFQRSFPDFHFIDRQLVLSEKEAPLFDYRKASLELGFDKAILAASVLEMGVTDPDEPGPASVLVPDNEEAERWREYFSGLTDLPVVGICWRGGTSSRARNRFYCDADAMLRALGPEQAYFVSLVHNADARELDEVRAGLGCEVHVPAGIDQKDELDRLASMLSVLDAVVSVDTAVCPLAAAMGTPTLRLGRSLMYLSDGHDAVLGSCMPMLRRSERFDLSTCLARASRQMADVLRSGR